MPNIEGLTLVTLTPEDRLSLIGLFMLCELAEWSDPPADLIRRLLDDDAAADVVLNFKLPRSCR